MNDLKLPLTALQLKQHLNEALGHKIDFDFLYTSYTTKNAGASVSDLLTVAEINELYKAVNEGVAIRAITTNTVVNILSAKCEAITGDDFTWVELAFIHNSKYVVLAFSRFGTGVYLDNKVVKEL